MSLFLQSWRERMAGRRYHEICYEELYADPEAHVRTLLGFFELGSTQENIDRIVTQADHRTAQDGQFFLETQSLHLSEDSARTTHRAFLRGMCRTDFGGGIFPEPRERRRLKRRT
jgi:hypothetical protein